MKKTYIFSMCILIAAVLYGVTMQITRSQSNSSPYASQENQLSTAQGWTEEAETRTWTFVSANAGNNTFVVTVNEEITSFMRPSLRVRAKQGAGYLYFIVHAVELDTTNTLVTLFGGTDFDLSAGNLTDVAWSPERFPLGFPTNPGKYSIEVIDANYRVQSPVTIYIWTNPGGANEQIALPVGVWVLGYEAFASGNTSANNFEIWTTLSTANNTESNSKLTDVAYVAAGGSSYALVGLKMSASDVVVITSQQTYYLNIMTDTSTVSSLYFGGNTTPVRIYAKSAYY